MNETWLVLDATYLCYRAYYAMPHSLPEDILPGMVYRFLGDVINLIDLHDTSNIVFCFDSVSSMRRDIYPTYKETRRNKRKDDDEEAKASLNEFYRQMKRLRTKYLPSIGFRNICLQEGFEADDIIAAASRDIAKNDEVIIVGSDSDLYQILGRRISIWNPSKKTLINKESFTEEWHIGPEQWQDVKAIAGCSSDDVRGVKGVGEKTAISFLTGSLNPESKKFETIVKSNDVWKRNLPIVTLPYQGTRIPEIYEDVVTKKKWRRVLLKLDMKPLIASVII